MRPGRQPWQPASAHVSADLARAIALIETTARVEKDIAELLRSMSSQDGSETAARRLKLAEEAIRGAHAAAERSEHLQQLARRWAEHVGVVTLRHSLAHAGAVLADLASTEESIASTLMRLADKDGSDLAAQRRHVADEALAAARSARDRAQVLQQLAKTGVAGAQPEQAASAREGAEPGTTSPRGPRRDPEERDQEAEDRDEAAETRDLAAETRNQKSVTRDATAQARDEVAVLRDRAMQERLHAASQRNHAARAREAADRAREATVSASADSAQLAQMWEEVAAARQDAADQREAAAVDREAAAILLNEVRQDRRAAAADRFAAANDREAANKDREAAARDRKAAAADRQQGAIERAQERILGTQD